MRVKMRGQISGTRDGKDWPAPGEVIDLPDAEAVQLIGQHMAEPAGDDDVETATTKTTPKK